MSSIKVRTNEEKSNPKFNYFIVLGLPVDASQSVINTALSAFGRQVLNSSDIYKRRLGELQSDIKETMEDPSRKKIEEAEAVKFRKKTLQESMVFLVNRGFVYKSELEKQAKVNILDYANAYDTIKHLFTSSVSFIDDTAGMAIYNQFEKTVAALKILNFNSLYEFYEVSLNSSVADIKNNQKKIIAQYKSIKDAKGTAAQDLLSSTSLKFITDPNDKKDYDFLLSIKEDVWDVLDGLKASSIMQITFDKKLDFIKKILSKNKLLTLGEAEERLGALLKKFNIRVTASDNGKSIIKRCRTCKSPYVFDPKSKTCPICNSLFVEPCWNCGNEVQTEESIICKHCNVDTKQSDLYFRDVAILKKELASWDMDAMSIAVKKFELKYRAFQKPKTEIKNQIEYAKKEFSRKENIEKQHFSSIDKHIASKSYFTANKVLTEFKKQAPSCDVSMYETKINSAIAEAKRVFQIVNTAKDEDSALIAYKRLLVVCSDYVEAHSIIRKYPPSPPRKPTAIVKPEGIEIAWQAPPNSENITYSIIRKKGSSPTNKTDGETIIDNYSGTIFIDNTAQNAVPYGYTIFATRYGINSRLSQTELSIKYADVVITEIKSITGGISVSWEAVKGVHKILVFRSTGAIPPSRIDEGVKILVGEKGFTDTSLPNTGMYGYLIVCTYKVGASITYSQGIRKTFEYYEKPSFVEDVKYNKNDNGSYVATFKKLKVGKFDIYASKTAIDLQPKEYYSVSKLKELIEIDCLNMTDISSDFYLPSNETYYVLPVCIEREVFTAGESHLFLQQEDDTPKVDYKITLNEKKSEIEVLFVSDTPTTLSDLIIISNRKKPLNSTDGVLVGKIESLILKKGVFSKAYTAKYIFNPTKFSIVMSYAVFAQNGKITFRRG